MLLVKSLHAAVELETSNVTAVPQSLGILVPVFPHFQNLELMQFYSFCEKEPDVRYHLCCKKHYLGGAHYCLVQL